MDEKIINREPAPEIETVELPLTMPLGWSMDASGPGPDEPLN